MRDLAHNLSEFVSLAPIAKTATTSGTTAIDTAGFNGCAVLVIPGVVTDGTHTPKLQESDTTTSGDFTDVAAANLVGSFAAIASGTLQEVGYIGSKRYLRAVVTVSGATTGAIYGVVAILGRANVVPVA